jgi:hypothetical protein
MLNSEALNSWLKLDTSVTSNTILSPSGYADADTATATGNASHLIYQNLAFTSGTAYTLSVFAKANTSDYIQLVLAGQFAANNYANFDLSNGTITASASVTAKIEDYGNGWYRCSISATATSSSTNSHIVYLINSPTAPRAQSFNASGESVYLWGGQFEAGSYATSYIPTYGTSVTFANDVCNNAGNDQVINSAEGVLYAEISGFENDLSDRYISLSDGGANNSIRIFYYQDGGTTFFRKNVNAVQTTIFSTNTINKSELTKIAIKYNSTNFDIFSNGVKLSTNLDSNSFPINTLNEINFANADGLSQPFYGKTKQVLYFPTALSDAELIALTT